MNFQGLSKIETADWYIDLAFRQAKERATQVRFEVSANRLIKSQTIEVEKIQTIERSTVKHLKQMLIAFPSLDSMNEFYKELVKATLDYADVKKSLGAVNWCAKRIELLSQETIFKIKKCKEMMVLNSFRQEYYGRYASLLKQIKKPLEVLENARKTMREYPSVKQDTFTICIAGFPNVGKTTLLSKITPSAPEIASYAFTTKSLNVGYIKTPQTRLQVIDTPGTLDRFEKMNPVEKQAYLAMKYCADIIVYVMDITESFPLELQIELLKKVQAMKKPVQIYYSKADIAPLEKMQAIQQKFPGISSAEELQEYLIKFAKNK